MISLKQKSPLIRQGAFNAKNNSYASITWIRCNGLRDATRISAWLRPSPR